MSTPTHHLATITRNDLEFLVRDYLPGSRWTIGGAFRFDSSVLEMANFLNNFVLVRTVDCVAGTPACAWSLDWFVERRPMGLQDFTAAVEAYAKADIGVMLVFDNPCITPDLLSDTYGAALLETLYRCDRVRKNSVCVASDALADAIRNTFPKFPVHCHVNRLVMEPRKRTAALYNELAQRYKRVCLHPQDAVRPSITSGIAEPARFDVVMNDPCLRTCPVRREHMKLLAEMRRNPYDMSLCTRRSSLIERTGCHQVDAGRLTQKRSLSLTRQEATALCQAGFRSFIVQGNQFRNEMTLLWDIFECMLDHSPELINKAALITSSATAQFGMAKPKLPSGLRTFSFSNYE